MLYIHFCKHCERIHMLNGHKSDCPICGEQLEELSIPFMDYVNFDYVQREFLIKELLKNNV